MEYRTSKANSERHDKGVSEDLPAQLPLVPISSSQALADAAMLYLEDGKHVEIADSPISAEPIALSARREQYFHIHARLGAGAEGVVYYASLIGEGWGDKEGKDAAIKVSHPFSVRRQSSLAGRDNFSAEDCKGLLEGFRAQEPALKTLNSLTGLERKLVPEIYGSATIPLSGRKGIALEVLALEFIEGVSLAEAISSFNREESDSLTVVSHIYESALTLREILLNGVESVDANVVNFLVQSSYHDSAPFSVLVDLGGAVLQNSPASQEAREDTRSHCIQMFACDCLEIREGPSDPRRDRAVEILENLEAGELSLTQACQLLELLLGRSSTNS